MRLLEKILICQKWQFIGLDLKKSVFISNWFEFNLLGSKISKYKKLKPLEKNVAAAVQFAEAWPGYELKLPSSHKYFYVKIRKTFFFMGHLIRDLYIQTCEINNIMVGKISEIFCNIIILFEFVTDYIVPFPL